MDYAALAHEDLILVDRIGHFLSDPRSLTRDAERGLLVKLRRGVYVRSGVWAEARPRERHLLRVRSVLAAAVRPVTVSGISAAAVWGMPIAGEWPRYVTVLDEWRGGGRTEPGVKRTAAGFRTAEVIAVDGLPVTTLTRTTLDVARRTNFADAIGSVDWALWRKNVRAVTKEMLFDDILRLDVGLGRRHMQRVVGFGTSLSDSFGESHCRVVSHLQGFDPPELQVEFRDQQGLVVPDFFWPSVRGAAEFDGKMKYTRDQYTGGDPAETVWREKKREDRLRRMVDGVTRILTEDVNYPERLVRLLVELGIPRGGRK
jgi:hypothetical protein